MALLHLLAQLLLLLFLYFSKGGEGVIAGWIEVGEGLKIRVAPAHTNRPERCLVLELVGRVAEVCFFLLLLLLLHMFTSAHVRLGPSATARPLRPTRGSLRFYCKASSYIPLKGLWLRLSPPSPCRPTGGFTEQDSCKALRARVGLCEFDGSRK